MSKYEREIKPNVYVDVYDVLRAFNVTDQAIGHAVKKMLCAGERGYKDKSQDIDEAIASLKRAKEMEEKPEQLELNFSSNPPDVYLYQGKWSLNYY